MKSVNKQTGIMNPNGLNDSPYEAGEQKNALQSRDIYSSYIFSTSSRSLSKYGERLLMEVISVAQEYTIDAALGIHKLNFGEKYKEKFAMIDIPVKNLLNADDTTNYTKAKEAAVELMKIYHTVEAPVLDDEGNPKTYSDGTPQYQFASYHLLDKVYVNQKPGIVSVKLGEDTWSQILDMGKGYTRYNLLTAKNLDDVVAIRLFQILSNQSEPLYFSLEKIKGILGLQDKYVNNPTGFIRRVIIPAEEEIKEKCPFEVVHEPKYEKTAGKGRPSIVGIATAVQPLIGYNYGAGKIARVRKALACAVAFAFGIGVCMWLTTRIWPEQIVSVFGVEDKLMDLTVYALFVQMLAIPLIGVQVIACNYFQATGPRPVRVRFRPHTGRQGRAF